jgi:outer membrane immunogenic protein
MRYLSFGAAVAFLLGSMAPAEAQLAPGTVDWTGFYLGGNAGYAWGTARVKTAFAIPGFPPANVATLSAAASPKINVDGFIGGGQAGYNWQSGNWVLGVEGDFDYFGLHGSRAVAGRFPPPGLNLNALVLPPIPFGVATSVSTDWLATLRPRVGVTLNNLLFYGTGGLAIASEKFRQTAVIGAVTDTTALSTVQVGWTVGGGVELALNPAWSLKAEYLYVDLGTTGAKAGTFNPAVVALSSSKMSLTSNIVRAGFNYHFPPASPPPAPAAMPAPPPAAPKVFIVFFDWDRDTITNEGRQIIAQAADAYKSGAPVQIQVTGYTDRSGSAGYNQRLSERRANNVAKALAALGVPPAQMVVSGRGENDNRVPTANGVREPQNRRVEIVTP